MPPRVASLRWIDATILDLRLEVDDGDDLFGSVLEAAGGGSIAVDSAHRPTFVGICGALWNSELYESVCPQLDDRVPMLNVVDHLHFLPATRRHISTELEFISSQFYDFLRRPDALRGLLCQWFTILCAANLRGLRANTSSMASYVKAPKRTGKCLAARNWSDWNITGQIRRRAFWIYFPSLRESKWKEFGESAAG
jgi:hypothetical protein